MKKIAIYGASLDPIANHHLKIIRKLAEIFDIVIVTPCGVRSDKPSTASTLPEHKKAASYGVAGTWPISPSSFWNFSSSK